MSESGRVRVLYVAGAGRSGTTLLAMLLGALPGMTDLGEVRHLWARGVRDNQSCGCGRTFHDCPFWGEVGESAFGGWGRVDVTRMVELQRRIDRFRSMPANMVGVRRAQAAEYLDAAVAVYRAASASGGGVVVDSSKAPSYLGLLRSRADIDLRVAHLIRDSRAVVHSWGRRHPLVGGQVRTEPLGVIGAPRSTLDWIANNLAIEMLTARGSRIGRVRYEDLVRDPARQAFRIGGDWAGSDHAPADDGTIDVGVQHTVAGNPMRLRHGRIAVRADDEWHRMAGWRQMAIAAATGPLLLRYGYRRHSHRA